MSNHINLKFLLVFFKGNIMKKELLFNYSFYVIVLFKKLILILNKQIEIFFLNVHLEHKIFSFDKITFLFRRFFLLFNFEIRSLSSFILRRVAKTTVQ
jgi:hypothetical protein